VVDSVTALAQQHIKVGRLTVEGGPDEPWKRRAFALAGSCLEDIGLYYFSDAACREPCGSISLSGSHVEVLEVGRSHSARNCPACALNPA
jgi:hypothetical protein